jgi:hypothetical protein
MHKHSRERPTKTLMMLLRGPEFADLWGPATPIRQADHHSTSSDFLGDISFDLDVYSSNDKMMLAQHVQIAPTSIPP